MTLNLALSRLHPMGDQSAVADHGLPSGVNVDSFAGPVHVEWDAGAAMTPLGQLPFFIDFLKTAGLFDAFVADCPLQYASPNAPKKRDVLGTTMLSMLSGHKRYAHIAALRGDGVLPELLDMSKIVSEDAVRRALKAIDEDEGAVWLRRHLDYCTAPLLAEPWILDIDTTVKPLYGHPSTSFRGNRRLVLSQGRLDGHVDGAELSVAVGIVGAFLGLAIGLQTELLRLQQFADDRMANLVSELVQFGGQAA